MNKTLVALIILAGCAGTGDDTLGVDGGGTVPAMITFGGQAAEVSTGGLSPMASLKIEAYKLDDDVTPIASATTDMLGNYIIMIPTSGQPFDGYLKARAIDFVDTYLYAPGALSASYAGAPLRMAKPDTIQLLNYACASDQLPNKGTIAAFATDVTGAPVGGVTLASTPSSNKYCYNDANGTPNSPQLTTSNDGVGYLFNVTGPITVSATKSGTTFQPRLVTARADVMTIVLVAP